MSLQPMSTLCFMILSSADTFSKLTLFKIFLFEYHQSVKQLGPGHGSKLFVKVNRRLHNESIFLTFKKAYIHMFHSAKYGLHNKL